MSVFLFTVYVPGLIWGHLGRQLSSVAAALASTVNHLLLQVWNIVLVLQLIRNWLNIYQWQSARSCCLFSSRCPMQWVGPFNKWWSWCCWWWWPWWWENTCQEGRKGSQEFAVLSQRQCQPQPLIDNLITFTFTFVVNTNFSLNLSQWTSDLGSVISFQIIIISISINSIITSVSLNSFISSSSLERGSTSSSISC